MCERDRSIVLTSIELLHLSSLVSGRIAEHEQFMRDQNGREFFAEEQLAIYIPLHHKLNKEIVERGL